MSRQQVRVLFVCLGNICRSPMSEGLMRDLAESRGLGERLVCDSAGTAAYHLGKSADARTRALLRSRGIAYTGRARQVRAEDFESFDWIMAMDQSNFEDLKRRCPVPLRERLRMVLEPTGGGSVQDPYYGHEDGFARNAEVLVPALNAWLDQWFDGSVSSSPPC